MRETRHRHRYGDLYVKTATILFTTGVLFVVVNLVLYAAIQIGKPYAKVGPMRYDPQLLMQAYPGESIDEIYKLQAPWLHANVEYEAYTQFRTRAVHTTHFNVDKDGFRPVKNQCAYPPTPTPYSIFVFGGSTTQGFGVRDSETIPSRIQEKLGRACVYNFGRAHYFNAQERMLFQKLLVDGGKPAMVIFIDGLNEYYMRSGEPAFTSNLQLFMNGSVLPQYLVERLPLMRVVNHLIPIRIGVGAESKVKREHVEERYFMSVRMTEAMADAFGIKAYFFIQPVPSYKYDLAYHVFAKSVSDLPMDRMPTTTEYAVFERMWRERNDPRITWLGNMQENRLRNLYVDKLHYTAAFTDEIADAIVAVIGKDVPS